MIYVWHHVICLALAVVAAMGLARARWVHRSPYVAVLLWQATALSMLTATVGTLLAVGLAPYQRGIVPALGALTTDLFTGTPARGLGVGHVAAVVVGLLLTCAAGAVQWRSSWVAHRHRARHKLLLSLVASSRHDERSLVVEHPAAAAYYLPGRTGCVVISSGALAALSGAELAAVLAHEHAHARQRHHVVLAPFHALRSALPSRAVQRTAARVELLVEMCADDHAARTHGRSAVAGALHRFCEIGIGAAPPGALAAAGNATALRIRRLQQGWAPVRPTLRFAMVATALIVATTPLSLYVLPA